MMIARLDHLFKKKQRVSLDDYITIPISLAKYNKGAGM